MGIIDSTRKFVAKMTGQSNTKPLLSGDSKKYSSVNPDDCDEHTKTPKKSTKSLFWPSKTPAPSTHGIAANNNESILFGAANSSAKNKADHSSKKNKEASTTKPNLDYKYENLASEAETPTVSHFGETKVNYGQMPALSELDSECNELASQINKNITRTIKEKSESDSQFNRDYYLSANIGEENKTELFVNYFDNLYNNLMVKELKKLNNIPENEIPNNQIKKLSHLEIESVMTIHQTHPSILDTVVDKMLKTYEFIAKQTGGHQSLNAIFAQNGLYLTIQRLDLIRFNKLQEHHNTFFQGFTKYRKTTEGIELPITAINDFAVGIIKEKYAKNTEKQPTKLA